MKTDNSPLTTERWQLSSLIPIPYKNGQFATTRRVLAARHGILCVKKSFMLYEVQDLSIWNLEFISNSKLQTKKNACGAKGR